jgi:catalase
VEIVAPAVGGVKASDGQRVPADQKIDGGPSVLYDAVAVPDAKQGTPLLAALPAARDFVADAYAHCKFIGYAGDAVPLFDAAGLTDLMDDGFADLDRPSAADLLSRCAQLRFWPSQAGIAEKVAAARG